MVTAILFRFKNLPGIHVHVQQISIPNCRTSIAFLIIICHSASAPHQCFCFYNIKSKSASYFWLLVMRTMQDGGKLSCGALNTCSKLMISPLSEGWFIIMPLFSWYSGRQKISSKINYKQILLIFASKELSFFLSSSQQRM